jgi:hypothetical protein
MKLYVTYGDKSSKEWQKVCELDLKPTEGLHPSMAKPEEVLSLNSESVFLPNGEQLEISASYSVGNRGMSINVFSSNKMLFQLGGFKYSETSYDPNIIFLTPKGLYLSLMMGS